MYDLTYTLGNQNKVLLTYFTNPRLLHMLSPRASVYVLIIAVVSATATDDNNGPDAFDQMLDAIDRIITEYGAAQDLIKDTAILMHEMASLTQAYFLTLNAADELAYGYIHEQELAITKRCVADAVKHTKHIRAVLIACRSDIDDTVGLARKQIAASCDNRGAVVTMLSDLEARVGKTRLGVQYALYAILRNLDHLSTSVDIITGKEHLSRKEATDDERPYPDCGLEASIRYDDGRPSFQTYRDCDGRIIM